MLDIDRMILRTLVAADGKPLYFAEIKDSVCRSLPGSATAEQVRQGLEELSRREEIGYGSRGYVVTESGARREWDDRVPFANRREPVMVPAGAGTMMESDHTWGGSGAADPHRF